MYIETSGYNKVDLMFTRNGANKDKLLIVDTSKHNTVVWDDKQIQHRTPKNISNANFLRSFIFITIYTNHANPNNTKQYGRLYPLVMHTNHLPKVKENYIADGGYQKKGIYQSGPKKGYYYQKGGLVMKL